MDKIKSYGHGKKLWMIVMTVVSSIILGVTIAAANVPTANADWSAGGGAASGSITGGGGASNLKATWWLGNVPGNEAGMKEVFKIAGNAYHYTVADWGSWTAVKGKNTWTKALNDAIAECNSRGKCTNPRLVSVGWVQCNSGRWYGPCSGGPGNAALNLKPNGPKYGNKQVGDLSITAMQGLPPSNRSVLDEANRARGKGTNIVVAMVVIGQEAYSPKKGWMPKWADYKAFDIKTTSNETSEDPITGIAEYQIHVEGYDGYVKGMSTKPKSYQTPFGSLLAAVNRGDNEWTWNGEHGTERKTFKNLSSKFLADQRKTDPSGAVRDANKNIKAAAEWALKQTDKMTIDFKIEDAPGVEGMTGKKITEAFKKGGQYKIVKKRKLQTIQFTGMNVDYYRRPLSGYYFDGWQECTNEKGCGHFGKTAKEMASVVPSVGRDGKTALNYRIAWKCPAPTGGKNDPYENCIYRGPEPSRGEWEKMPHKNGPDNDRKFYIDAINDPDFRWKGRILWTVQAARNNSPNEGGLTLGRNYSNGFKWLQSNWEREAYAGTNDEAWISTTHFKPAPNAMQSPVVVALQDFAHVNCNKVDFDKYVDHVRSLKTPQGDTLLDEGSVKSTKYDGYFNTKLVTDPNPVNVKQQLGSMTTVLLRQPGNTVFKAGDKLTNGKEPTLVNWQIQWGSTTWNTSGKNSGQIDPTYTKECPFDCVADTSVVRSNIRKGVANDPKAPGDTRTNNDILAKDAYGVQVWPNKNGQDPDLNGPYKANTSHMQFFRNNEWNYFTVDRWAPASTDGIRYDGGDAKSTTIVRNADGTPWMANGTRLTNMDANAGGWKPLFNGNGSVVNQWSSSTNDRFDTNMSNQIGGQATQFRIKSAWATENGKPLKFNVKWEYEVDNTVRTPTVWKIRNNGTNLDTVSVTTVDQTTKVDGKCDSQFNKTGQVYQDHTDYAQQGTGVTRKNTQDVNFEEDNPMKGWFSITFVRATSE